MQIRVSGLRKNFGDKRVISGISFTVKPGQVTGLVGPNGAGKTTILRILLALEFPTAGNADFGGTAYAKLKDPIMHVGAALDVDGMHPGLTAYGYLRSIAAAYGISRKRVLDVLEQVGLRSAMQKRVESFSLGMKQRLNIAGAMLGDPHVYIFDESLNGLDVEGITWFRRLMENLSKDGKTVLVSSHQMSELELFAQRVIVIGGGRVLADAMTSELLGVVTSVMTPDSSKLTDVLTSHGYRFEDVGQEFVVYGVSPSVMGELAALNGIILHGLTAKRSSLENVYKRLVENSLEFRAIETSR